MELTIAAKVMWASFAIALVMGALVQRSGFCTMGGVSDLINMNDGGRLGSWFLAIGIATVGVAAMTAGGLVDMSLTTGNDTSQPPYRVPMFVWPRYIVGGLLFGIGMTLGSGCGNKTVVRLGGGNLKSIFVLAMIGLGSYVMMFTNFGYLAFLQWMNPLAINFADYGVASQDVGSLAAAAVGAEAETGQVVAGLVLGGALLTFAFRQRTLRTSFDNLLGGIAVGTCVAALWYVTAGELGQAWLNEVEWLDVRPLAVGAQSMTFISPSGQAFNYLLSGFDAALITLGMVIVLGVILGSLVNSLLSRTFRFEWFVDLRDFVYHVIGGLLMGIGGVLSMGCSIGQGITGSSTLALGSVLALVSIMLGCALALKVQYYKLVYEEEAGFVAALLTSLVDLRLLPKGLRRLEAV
ncbi:MAG TPA: YeeE/YedE family protein [Gammaproteobacteria bacterium]